MRCLRLCLILVALVSVPCFCGCSEQIDEPPASESGVGDPPSEFEGATPEKADPDDI